MPLKSILMRVACVYKNSSREEVDPKLHRSGPVNAVRREGLIWLKPRCQRYEAMFSWHKVLFFADFNLWNFPDWRSVGHGASGSSGKRASGRTSAACFRGGADHIFRRAAGPAGV